MCNRPRTAAHSAMVLDMSQIITAVTLMPLQIEDSEDVLREKCAKLAEAIRDARHVVIYTGAGISTVCTSTA